MLLYDERMQRRPIIKYQETKASFTALCSAHRERQCLAGTTRGYLQHIDLRNPGKCLKTFKNFTGGISGIACDPDLPVVATSSIDRFLRIHNLNTKELLHKEYLKQSLTTILMKPIVKNEKEEDIEKKTEEVDEEYESLFENMQTVVEESKQKKIKRKLRLESESVMKKSRKKKKIPSV